MTRRQLGAAILTTLLIAGFSGAARAGNARTASSQSAKRVVVMAISVPKKGVPPLQLTAREGETVTISIDGFGKFGFEPTLRKSDESTVTVAVFDVGSDPSKRLGDTQVPVAGKAVQSKTSPSFGIQVVRVTQPK